MRTMKFLLQKEFRQILRSKSIIFLLSIRACDTADIDAASR